MYICGKCSDLAGLLSRYDLVVTEYPFQVFCINIVRFTLIDHIVTVVNITKAGGIVVSQSKHLGNKRSQTVRSETLFIPLLHLLAVVDCEVDIPSVGDCFLLSGNNGAQEHACQSQHCNKNFCFHFLPFCFYINM